MQTSCAPRPSHPLKVKRHVHSELQCPFVMWHVRSKLQCPPVATYPYEPKWDLEAAAAEYADVTLEPEEEPPKPD
eukprot:793706-Pelagomonas_calceolata.AAC.6